MSMYLVLKKTREPFNGWTKIELIFFVVRSLLGLNRNKATFEKEKQSIVKLNGQAVRNNMALEIHLSLLSHEGKIVSFLWKQQSIHLNLTGYYTNLTTNFEASVI